MKTSSSRAQGETTVQCADLLAGIPTQAHAGEVRKIMAGKYSASSRASINAALHHWDIVRDQWGWSRVIHSGDPHRGGKLATFVLHLMEVKPFY